MISTQQLEAFWQRYQSEGVPNGLSMQAFCSMNNVPYNCFERHVKQRAKCCNIQPVTITGLPEEEKKTGLKEPEKGNSTSSCKDKDQACPTRILVSIKMSNGFQIHRSNIDYQTLVGLVEKMEAIC